MLQDSSSKVQGLPEVPFSSTISIQHQLPSCRPDPQRFTKRPVDALFPPYVPSPEGKQLSMSTPSCLPLFLAACCMNIFTKVTRVTFQHPRTVWPCQIGTPVTSSHTEVLSHPLHRGETTLTTPRAAPNVSILYFCGCSRFVCEISDHQPVSQFA